jgi:hypothetical protein
MLELGKATKGTPKFKRFCAELSGGTVVEGVCGIMATVLDVL